MCFFKHPRIGCLIDEKGYTLDTSHYWLETTKVQCCYYKSFHSLPPQNIAEVFVLQICTRSRSDNYVG